MRSTKPDFLNRNNGAPHPFQGGGLFIGKILAVKNKNRVSVNVPGLSLTIRDCPFLGTTNSEFPAIGDRVVCGFLGNDNQELVIIGKMNTSADVYATKLEFNDLLARVASLEAQSHDHE